MNRRDDRTGADVDDYRLGAVRFAVHLDAAIAGESRMAVDESEPLSPCLEAVHHRLPPSGDDRVLALDDRCEVDLDLSGGDTQPAAVTGHVCRPRTGDHRLRRRATGIDAGPAGGAALGEDHPFAGAGEARGEWNSCLATADNDDVYIHGGPRRARGAQPRCPVYEYRRVRQRKSIRAAGQFLRAVRGGLATKGMTKGHQSYLK